MIRSKRKADKVRVRLGQRSYDVIIGRGILGGLGARARQIEGIDIGRSVCILTDSNVNKYYGAQAVKSFKNAGFKDIKKLVMKAGERSKTFKEVVKQASAIAKWDKYGSKKLLFVNLGGGVVSDLGGFIACIYRRRESPYVQVPTSLLAQVDCGVGGKVGVNLPAAKNMLGHFWQPRLVYVDIDLLKTLPKRELKSGLAEVVKYGVIADPKLFAFLEKNCEEILKTVPGVMKHIVVECLKIKARMVEKDEEDVKGIRIKLNFGHTIGHAIESSTHYRNYTHGEAISVGMVCAKEIADSIGMLSVNENGRLEKLLSAIRLPSKIRHCTAKQIMESIRHDKKAIDGVNRFVLPVSIGRVKVKKNVAESLIRRVINSKLTQ